jgi:hypothetical protein
MSKTRHAELRGGAALPAIRVALILRGSIHAQKMFLNMKKALDLVKFNIFQLPLYA